MLKIMADDARPGDNPPPYISRRSEFWAGVRATIPLVIGATPFGIIFGALAINSGKVAGAALDVIETEPPADGAPILSAPNTILLPHIGTATVETRAAMLDLCLRNLLAVLGRKVPPECVNTAALERALTR